jgi:hypothetical protein
MRRIVLLFCAAAVLAFLGFDWAVGQGTNCRNGMCPTQSTATMPVEAEVFTQQAMGPVEKKIVEIEKNALEKWYSGDPTAYIAMVDKDIGYFEPILDKRLDGKEPLTKIYEALRGKVRAEKFDMLNTRVQATEKMAVLSFNLVSIEGGVPYRWNCSEVFALNKVGEWKLVHSHWSQTKPQCRQ